MSYYHLSPASLDGLLRHLEHGCGTCRRNRVRRTLGDRVLLSNGNEVAISGIQSYNVEATKVYNLEVEDNHTYFAGKDGVLVHNYDIKTGKVEKGDTISKIRIELNEKYGTNYSNEDVKKMNGLIDVDKIYEKMRIVSPDSFKKLEYQDKAEYFNSSLNGKEESTYLRMFTAGASGGLIFVDSNAETGSYTEIKRRGDFEARTTHLGFEATLYSKELMPSLGFATSVNSGIYNGNIHEYSNSDNASFALNGNGITNYYDKDGTYKGTKVNVNVPGLGYAIKIRGDEYNVATSSWSTLITNQRPTDYYYNPGFTFAPTNDIIVKGRKDEYK